MTREEAIRLLTTKRAQPSTDWQMAEVYAMAIKALRQEPKYCDRNICIKNEYNGIGCDECEVTKSQEPKTGHWIDMTSGYAFNDKCSECGYIVHIQFINEYKYCPNCGRRMVEP